MPGKHLLLPLVLLAVLVSTAEPVTIAHFTAKRVDDVCAVDDSEPLTAGDPDLRFRMIIQDLPEVFNCNNGCDDDDNRFTLDAKSVDRCGFFAACGTWDFTDVTLDKVIPDQLAPMFNFHLIDDDTDEDDYLGGWAKEGLVATQSAQEWNNRTGITRFSDPSSVCGEAVEGSGWFSNYRLTYTISYTDTDGPLPLAAPVALENGHPTSADYDGRLDFSWALTEDPNTGISRYRVTLLDVNTGLYVFQDFNPTTKNPVSFSVCAAGCGFSYAPIVGHQYLFKVSATNGLSPGITNPMTTESPWVSVFESDVLGVDDAPAAVLLTAPVPNPTQEGATFVYSLPTAGPARLEVIDLQGRRVALLADRPAGPGTHPITWSGLDASGQRVKPGAYWVRLHFANAHKLQRLVVVR